MTQTDTELLPTRASLIRRLKQWQSDSGWREFFRIYWRLIYSVARKAGLTDVEAQAAVQGTVAGVAEQLPNFEYKPAIGPVKGWLRDMTHGQVIEQFRKREPPAARNLGGDSRAVEFASSGLDFEAMWETQWQLNLRCAAIEKLKRRVDPARYQVFDCLANRKWPATKVADRFSVPLDQVNQAEQHFAELLRAEIARLEQEMT